jgi:hypothetical protein
MTARTRTGSAAALQAGRHRDFSCRVLIFDFYITSASMSDVHVLHDSIQVHFCLLLLLLLLHDAAHLQTGPQQLTGPWANAWSHSKPLETAMLIEPVVWFLSQVTLNPRTLTRQMTELPADPLSKLAFFVTFYGLLTSVVCLACVRHRTTSRPYGPGEI